MLCNIKWYLRYLCPQIFGEILKKITFRGDCISIYVRARVQISQRAAKTRHFDIAYNTNSLLDQFCAARVVHNPRTMDPGTPVIVDNGTGVSTLLAIISNLPETVFMNQVCESWLCRF